MSKIYFVCPDINEPAGGVKQIYRQVDVLNKNGYQAFVVHGHKHFRVNWFQNRTPVVWDPLIAELGNNTSQNFQKKFKAYVKNAIGKTTRYNSSIVNDRLHLTPEDIIVLPEFYGKAINDVFQNQNTVVYNQNCYYSFRGYGIPSRTNSEESIYKQDRLQAVIVASTDAASYLKNFINDKPIYRVKYGINNEVFSFKAQKKRQIAFMPRKLREDSEQILNILKLKKAFINWDIVPITGMNEEQVAKVLQDSAVFLSFNHREGFGMPPAEAMSCGCVVIGYHGQGGKEYFLPELTYNIPQRNVQVFTKTLEQVILEFDSDPDKMKIKGLKASTFISNTYSMNQEEESILKVWQAILNN